MTSINTNASAMTALRTLNQTNSMLDQTQNRISTGMKVSEASDNAAYWSIATTMRSDNSAMGTVQDALGLGAGKVDVAYTGMNSAMEVVDQIKTKLVAASEPGIDKSAVQAEISQLQEQLEGITSASSFSGENWLASDSANGATKSIVSSFNRGADGTVSIGKIDVDISSARLVDTNATAKTGILDSEFTVTSGNKSVLTLDVSSATDADLAEMIAGVDAAYGSMTTAASDLGAAKARIDIQTNFVSDLMDAVDRGIGTLVDADMTKESTKLSALQTQQQLGIQALSIANSGAQSILSLFR